MKNLIWWLIAVGIAASMVIVATLPEAKRTWGELGPNLLASAIELTIGLLIANVIIDRYRDQERQRNFQFLFVGPVMAAYELTIRRVLIGTRDLMFLASKWTTEAHLTRLIHPERLLERWNEYREKINEVADETELTVARFGLDLTGDQAAALKLLVADLQKFANVDASDLTSFGIQLFDTGIEIEHHSIRAMHILGIPDFDSDSQVVIDGLNKKKGQWPELVAKLRAPAVPHSVLPSS